MYVEFLKAYRTQFSSAQTVMFERGDCIGLEESEAAVLMRQGIVRPVFEGEAAVSNAA